MRTTQKIEVSDQAIRHYIYSTFIETSLPPTSERVAHHFKTSILEIEKTFERLAKDHQIALAPGTHLIWMAHPFSALSTHYFFETTDFCYWGN